MKNTKEIHKSDLWRVLNQVLMQELPKISYLSDKKIIDASQYICDKLNTEIYDLNKDELKDKDYGNGTIE